MDSAVACRSCSMRLFANLIQSCHRSDGALQAWSCKLTQNVSTGSQFAGTRHPYATNPWVRRTAQTPGCGSALQSNFTSPKLPSAVLLAISSSCQYLAVAFRLHACLCLIKINNRCTEGLLLSDALACRLMRIPRRVSVNRTNPLPRGFGALLELHVASRSFAASETAHRSKRRPGSLESKNNPAC